jgi:hypothetical protein
VLGLPGYPRAPLWPATWRQVAGGAESMCSWVVIVHRLLKEMLAMVDQDVLQPVSVSPMMERRGFYTSLSPILPWPPNAFPFLTLRTMSSPRGD